MLQPTGRCLSALEEDEFGEADGGHFGAWDSMEDQGEFGAVTGFFSLLSGRVCLSG